jgi:hypothetical protein
MNSSKLTRLVLLIALLASSLVAAKPWPGKQYELRVVNRSGVKIEIKLTGISDENAFYYLHVPKGDEEWPYEKTFAIASGDYNMQVYFIEIYDPVYGYSCRSAPRATLRMARQVEVFINSCDARPRNGGEPSQMKLRPQQNEPIAT